MVPPLVTASRWPPGRPCSMPVVRSQTSRGRSSANSSLGYRPASMSSTASSTGRVRPVNGAARRTTWCRSSTAQSSSAVIATICWASTSSGLRGMLQLLDLAAAHPPGHHRGLDQVALVLGEDDAAAHVADVVPGPAGALQAAGHRRRRLDLDDQVHRAHVDAEFQAGRGDHGGQPARLERLLDLGPLLPGHRAVVGPGHLERRAAGGAGLGHDLGGRGGRTARGGLAGLGAVPEFGALGGQLVEPGAQPLGQPPGVGEHDRGAVLLDQVEHLLLHVRPDGPAGRLRRPACRPRGRPAGRGRSCPRPGPRCSGRSACCWAGRRWSPAGPRPGTTPRPPAGRTVADRPIRWAGPRSAVSASSRSSDRARCAPRLLPASACTSSTMTVSTPRSASRALEVSSRNSDSGVVIRMSGGLVASRRRSSAAVSPVRTATRMSGSGAAHGLRGVPDPGQRGAQVPLDVHRERFQRRDVQHAAALLGVRRGG